MKLSEFLPATPKQNEHEKARAESFDAANKAL